MLMWFLSTINNAENLHFFWLKQIFSTERKFYEINYKILLLHLYIHYVMIKAWWKKVSYIKLNTFIWNSFEEICHKKTNTLLGNHWIIIRYRTNIQHRYNIILYNSFTWTPSLYTKIKTISEKPGIQLFYSNAYEIVQSTESHKLNVCCIRVL